MNPLKVHRYSLTYDWLLSDSSELWQTMKKLLITWIWGSNNCPSPHGPITAIWVLDIWLTFIAICSAPWSYDWHLQDFCWKLVFTSGFWQKPHSEQWIHLTTIHLLNNDLRKGCKIGCGHVVTHLITIMTRDQNYELSYDCKSRNTCTALGLKNIYCMWICPGILTLNIIALFLSKDSFHFSCAFSKNAHPFFI